MKNNDEKISVFILKAQAHSLSPAESYLKNRQWTIASSANLKEALAYIIQKQPQYILVTSDHSNKKVKSLPKVLLQAFPAKVIGFSEKSSVEASKNLSSLGLEYNLYAPVSGPAIERMILKIRKDDEVKVKKGEPASITFKHDGAPAAQDLLAQIMNSETDPSNAAQIIPSNAPSFQDWEQEQKKKPSAQFEITADMPPKKAKKARYFKQAAEFKGKPSIIVKGVEEALENSVNIIEGDTFEIEVATNVACLTIESPRFSGYLVCAIAKDQKVDEALLHMINKRLFFFLKDKGEDVKEHDAIGIKIQSVDFIDWSIEKAQFLRKSTHQGQEIAMAFFPYNKAPASFEKSESCMLKFSLDELKEDVEVDFDVFIYMPENNKYILYTPEGSKLYGKQKARLKDKGISHMHIRETSLNGLKKYQAQNYLNEQIEIYKKSSTDETA